MIRTDSHAIEGAEDIHARSRCDGGPDKEHDSNKGSGEDVYINRTEVGICVSYNWPNRDTNSIGDEKQADGFQRRKADSISGKAVDLLPC